VKYMGWALAATMLGAWATEAEDVATKWPEHELLTEEIKAELAEDDLALNPKLNANSESTAYAAAFGIIDASPETVFETLLDYEAQELWAPKVESAHLNKDDENPASVRFTTKVMLRTREYHLLFDADRDTRRIVYTLDEERENYFEQVDGYWQVLPYRSDQSVVVYVLDIITGVSVPAWMQRGFVTNDLPDIMESLKKRVESGGTWTK